MRATGSLRPVSARAGKPPVAPRLYQCLEAKAGAVDGPARLHCSVSLGVALAAGMTVDRLA
jgi:hypothetical protein